jgi:hypothetical protein
VDKFRDEDEFRTWNTKDIRPPVNKAQDEVEALKLRQEVEEKAR